MFARLARDLVNGALSHTSAFSAKVATTPADVEPNHRYLISLYLPDLYDKAAVTEVWFFYYLYRPVKLMSGNIPGIAYRV